MSWKESFKEGKELVLATASELGQPNANIVISLGFVDDKLMVADIQMSTTIQNLNGNPKICVIGGYYKIRGTAKIITSGKLFNKCAEVVASQDQSLKVRNAIVISVEEIFDLENAKKIV